MNKKAITPRTNTPATLPTMAAVGDAVGDAVAPFPEPVNDGGRSSLSPRESVMLNLLI